MVPGSRFSFTISTMRPSIRVCGMFSCSSRASNASQSNAAGPGCTVAAESSNRTGALRWRALSAYSRVHESLPPDNATRTRSRSSIRPKSPIARPTSRVMFLKRRSSIPFQSVWPLANTSLYLIGCEGADVQLPCGVKDPGGYGCLRMESRGTRRHRSSQRERFRLF